MSIFERARILKVNPEDPEEQAIRIASEIIKDGGLVAFPTETVYGLGASYLNEKAVKRIYEVKNRPRNKPLTLHISHLDMLKDFVSEIPELVQRLINCFWPGPLTIIVTSKDGQKLGFRMPRHKVAYRLIHTCGVPLVVPSANLSGTPAPTDADEVCRNMEHRIDMVLDAGKTQVGLESTIVDTTIFPYRMLREGAIIKSRISDAWYCV